MQISGQVCRALLRTKMANDRKNQILLAYNHSPYFLEERWEGSHGLKKQLHEIPCWRLGKYLGRKFVLMRLKANILAMAQWFTFYRNSVMLRTLRHWSSEAWWWIHRVVQIVFIQDWELDKVKLKEILEKKSLSVCRSLEMWAEIHLPAGQCALAYYQIYTGVVPNQESDVTS